MYFGLMTGSYAKNASGGVLRKRISSITDEIDTNTGIFKAGTTAVGSIIQTIDKLRVYGYTFAIENPGPGVKQPDNANTGFLVVTLLVADYVYFSKRAIKYPQGHRLQGICRLFPRVAG